MTARPGLCILDSREQDLCRMNLSVSWRSEIDRDYCLYSSQADGALQCWQQQRTGQLRVPMEARQDVMLWLEQAGQAERLAPIRIRILHKEPRNKRWQRRHPWSVF